MFLKISCLFKLIIYLEARQDYFKHLEDWVVYFLASNIGVAGFKAFFEA